MPNYNYIGKSLDSETKTGRLYAEDERELAQNLKRSGIILIKADALHDRSRQRFDLPPIFSRISLTDKIIMLRNLEVMFSTGLSLIKSFDILVAQARNEKMKNILTDVKEKINKGSSLSDALSGHPDVFSELFVNMIKVGEESGTLDEVFQILSLQFKKEHELKSKIRNVMIYPCIILAVMAVVGIIMITFVFPSLKIFFSTLGADIPIYTLVMLYIGDFLTNYWYLLIVIPLLIVFSIYVSLKSKEGKKAIDTFLLRLPVLSPIIKKSNSAFLIRSISSLISSGVPLTRSLEISSKTIGNFYFKKATIEAAEKIKKGEKLSDALKPHQDLFPFGVIEMMEVGEETGKTSVVLKKLADFYEQEAVNAIEKLTTLIEPALIIMLGLGVGVFAFSIIEPMYSSLEAITQ